MKEYILYELIKHLEYHVAEYEACIAYEVRDHFRELYIKKVTECVEAIEYLKNTWQEEII